MCDINHPKFPCKTCAKNAPDKDVTFVNFGFMLNVTTLIIYITGIFKTVMNPRIV